MHTNNMGVTVSKIWGGGHRYTSDSTTGLTGEEKALLADTFAVLKQDLPKSGERLFILYFTDYPEHKNYFRDFKGKPLEELQASPKLIAHATNVMSSLNGIIVNLNEPEILVEFIKKIGYGHGRRHIAPQAFVDLKSVFLKLLQEKLKTKYNPAVAEVWGKTIDVIATVFQSGAQEFLADKNQE